MSRRDYDDAFRAPRPPPEGDRYIDVDSGYAGSKYHLPERDRSSTDRKDDRIKFIKKRSWYPNLRRSLHESGVRFREDEKDFVLFDVTDDEVAEIKRNALEARVVDVPDPSFDVDGSSSSDDEYDLLHYPFKPDVELEDETPPRVLNPGPHTWWFDVPLKSSGDEHSPLKNIFHEMAMLNGQGSSTYHRAFTINRQQPESQKSIKCVTKRIISSRRSIRAEVKDDTIKLIAASPNPSGRETSLDDLRFRWIHYQNPVLNLEEFREQVLRISDLEDHDLTILWDLFERVKDKMERTYIHGKYLEEGAIRCDGKSGKECCAATFIVIPALKLQPLELPSILKGQPKAFQSADHAPRPLMQTRVNMSSTLEEDKRQATFSSKLIPKDQAIHVVQTWILVINDKLLVTYSSSALEDIAGPSIEIEDGKQDDGVTIRVGTTFDGAHYFPAEKCKTWFEFQAELKKVMRPSRYENYKEKDAIITCKDGTILNSQNWAAKLGETRLKLFRLTLELKSRQTALASSTGPLSLPPPGDDYTLVPYSGRPQRRPSVPPSRLVYRQPSDADFEKNPGRDRSRQLPYNFYSPDEKAAVPLRSNRSEYESTSGYGAGEADPYRPRPISNPYGHSRSTVPEYPDSSFNQNGNYGTNRELSRPPMGGRGRHNAAFWDPRSGSSPRPSPRSPSLESRDRLGTTVTEVADETDAPSRYDLASDDEESEGSRWRSRRRFPLAILPPPDPVPDEKESSPAPSTKDEPEGPAGSGYRGIESSTDRPVSPLEDFSAYSETTSTSSESDDEMGPKIVPRKPQPPASFPAVPQTPGLPPRQTRAPSSDYRGLGNSDSASGYRDLPSSKQPTSGDDTRTGKLNEYEPEDLELRKRYFGRAGRRVTFASSLPSQPSFRSDIDTVEDLSGEVSNDVSKLEYRSHRRYSPARQSSTFDSREDPARSRNETKEAKKHPDHDSIFFYLPSERSTEKEKGKGVPDQKQPIPELPKVLPVFQWLTKASAENKLIERQLLSRKRSASRGSRNSNTLKKAPQAEVEASDESYSILKNILNEIHRRLETNSFELLRDTYLSCGSSDSLEVEKSIMEIENTTLLLADSPEKNRTLDLIAERKKILDVCRKIISFFIPLNWKDGQVIERLWYSILQVVTVGINETLHLPSDTLLKLESINRHIQVIVAGVAGDNMENPSFRIPSALFEAFLQFVEAMLFAAVGVVLLKGDDLPPSAMRSDKKAAIRREVDKRLTTCKSRLREGKFQLMCMILTGRTKDQMNYEEACTETVVSFILRSLICLPISEVEGASSPMSIYRERLMNIDTEAKYRPQQRILQDILNLGQEVGAFDKVRVIQSRVLWAADTLLHPKGSLDMKEPRSQDSLIYSPPRGKMGGGVEYFFVQEEDHVKDYLKRANNLYGSVEEALSLKEEDNGKAIMVFTIVTTVFLPLNFVTSFFGMNTTDIRDISHDQKIFWTTAIPVTIGVLGFALCWAYFGDEIQDRLFGPYSPLGKLFKGRLNSHRTQQVAKVIAEKDGDEFETENYEPAPKYSRDDYETAKYDTRPKAPAPYNSRNHDHYDRADPAPYNSRNHDHYDRADPAPYNSRNHDHYDRADPAPPDYYERNKDRDRSYSRPQSSGRDYTSRPAPSYRPEPPKVISRPYESRTRSSGYEGSSTNEDETRYRPRGKATPWEFTEV
ncbi:hypothetical protein TWF506_007356 [Arthrobotrys conoides]|uniref:Mg2+ transporter n=1 Tax=Arthrobotrys conoides TaxID=74498 RepID=A0AAN8N749_9PEZI